MREGARFGAPFHIWAAERPCGRLAPLALVEDDGAGDGCDYAERCDKERDGQDYRRLGVAAHDADGECGDHSRQPDDYPAGQRYSISQLG